MLSIRNLFICDCTLQAVDTLALGAYAYKFSKKENAAQGEAMAWRIHQWRIASPLVMGSLYLAAGCSSHTKYRLELIMSGAAEITLSYGRWKIHHGQPQKTELMFTGLVTVFYLVNSLVRAAPLAAAQIFVWQGSKASSALKRGFFEIGRGVKDLKFLTQAFARSSLPIGKLFTYFTSFVMTYLIEVSEGRWMNPLRYVDYAAPLASLGLLRLGCLFFIQKSS